MAKGILLINFVLIYLYSSMLAPLAKIGIMATGTREPPEAMFPVLAVLLFVPEITLIFSGGFRRWIKRGIEGDDGKFDKADFKDLFAYFISLGFSRLVAIWSLMHMFYDTDIISYLYTILVLGSFGTAGLPILKGVLKR